MKKMSVRTSEEAYLQVNTEEKKKKSFKGKENQEGISGHSCFPLFSLELEVMKE